MVNNQKKNELIEIYSIMADRGYTTSNNEFINKAFSDMEIYSYRKYVKELFLSNNIKTILDYGCGGSDYLSMNFENNQSAKDYFELDNAYLYEPARVIDERRKVDAVVCFDVLEHIFINDLYKIIRELFSNANKLLVVNVACYSAKAILPNGDNAHITVRSPQWWKGVFDNIATDYPDVKIKLWCSIKHKKSISFEVYSASDWLNTNSFVINKTKLSYIELKENKNFFNQIKEYLRSIYYRYINR